MKPRTLCLISAAAAIAGAAFAEFGRLYWMTGALGIIAYAALVAALATFIRS